ncbi:MAG: hypothetical protein OQJ84_11080 [Xanthomonadales bacterium]|nr:hypothetical protein [Xanthomonadales bacterium]
MNQFESNTSSALVETIPLFASVWVALYYMLRRNFQERRLAAIEPTEE